MFITCPNCKELVKKGVGECPLCKYSITAEDIMKAEQEDKEKSELFIQEKMEEYGRREKTQLRISIIFLVLFVAIIPLSFLFPHPLVAFFFMEITVIAALFIVVYVKKCNECPYCNRWLPATRSFARTDFCPRCGGRLR